MLNKTLFTVCPAVEDSPKWKLAFWYPVTESESDSESVNSQVLTKTQAIFMKICKPYRARPNQVAADRRLKYVPPLKYVLRLRYVRTSI